MGMKRAHAGALAVGAPLGCALLGAAVGSAGLRTWYPNLRTSRLILPLWAFTPAALAYTLICGRILYRLLTLELEPTERRRALLLLSGMMAANEGWNYLFLGRKSVRAGWWGMLGYVLLTVRLYRRLQQTDVQSARWLRPYVAWLGYDLVYAFELWRLNRDERRAQKSGADLRGDQRRLAM